MKKASHFSKLANLLAIFTFLLIAVVFFYICSNYPYHVTSALDVIDTAVNSYQTALSGGSAAGFVGLIIAGVVILAQVIFWIVLNYKHDSKNYWPAFHTTVLITMLWYMIQKAGDIGTELGNGRKAYIIALILVLAYAVFAIFNLVFAYQAVIKTIKEDKEKAKNPAPAEEVAAEKDYDLDIAENTKKIDELNERVEVLENQTKALEDKVAEVEAKQEEAPVEEEKAEEPVAEEVKPEEEKAEEPVVEEEAPVEEAPVEEKVEVPAEEEKAEEPVVEEEAPVEEKAEEPVVEEAPVEEKVEEPVVEEAPAEEAVEEPAAEEAVEEDTAITPVVVANNEHQDPSTVETNEVVEEENNGPIQSVTVLNNEHEDVETAAPSNEDTWNCGTYTPEEKAEEPVAEEAAAEEPVVEEEKAEEPVAEEEKAEEVPAEEAKAEEPVAEEAPVEEKAEEPVAEEAPVEEAPVEEKAEEPVAEEAAAEEAVVEEAPVEEEKVEEAAEEAAEEPAAEEEAAEEEVEENNGPKSKYTIVRNSAHRSFCDKFLEADKETLDNYNILRNELVSYGLKERMSAGGDSYRRKRVDYAKIRVTGKHLTIYLAVDPSKFEGKSFIKDVGAKNKYKAVPTSLKIKSPLSVRRAKQYIAEMMKEAGYTQKAVGNVDYATQVKKDFVSRLVEKNQIVSK